MPETFDEYIDAFLITTGSFGATLQFRRSPSVASTVANPAQPRDVGCVRMSMEHLKAMTFLLHQEIQNYEARHGVSVPMSLHALNAMKIAPEDWEQFWKRSDE